jgi:hypothetical protein
MYEELYGFSCLELIMFQQSVAIVRGPAIKKKLYLEYAEENKANATHCITGNDLYYILTEDGEKSRNMQLCVIIFTDPDPFPVCWALRP